MTDKGVKVSLMISDMKLLGHLLGEVVAESYGQPTFDFIEVLRLLVKERSSFSYEKIFYEIELLPKEKVNIILRSFGIFLGLLTLIQRVHKVVEYEKENSLQLNQSDLLDGDDNNFPSIHFLFTSNPNETLSIEASWFFEQLFEEIYRYRKKTTNIFDQSMITSLKTIIKGMLVTSLLSKHPSVHSDINFLVQYFRTSIYPGVGKLLYKLVDQEPIKLNELLKFSTWIGADYDIKDTKSADLKDAIVSYKNVLIESYKDSLGNLELSFDLESINTTASQQLAIEEIRRSLNLKNNIPIEKIKGYLIQIKQSLLNEPNKGLIIIESCNRFLVQLEIFGESGIVIEPKISVKALIGMVEQLYQKIFLKRLKRTYQDNIKNLIFLINEIKKISIQGLNVILIDEHQQTLDICLSLSKELSIQKLILSQVETTYELIIVTLLINGLFSKEIKLTPVFEKIESIEHSSLILKEYYDLCKELELTPLVDEVMMGYSDSARESGFWAAQTKIYHAHEKLDSWSTEQQIPINFFQGRGGSIARGGFPTKHLIATSQLNKERRALKLSIQGEMVRQRFGCSEITAMSIKRYLIEIQQSVKDRENELEYNQFLKIRELMAQRCIDEYKYYTEEERDFFDYFYATTPVEMLNHFVTNKQTHTSIDGNINYGAWNMPWAQNRFFIPVWLGMSNVCELLSELDEQKLEKIFKDRFVYSTFMLVLLSLEKVDLFLVKEYEDQLASPHLIEFGRALRAMFEQVYVFSRRFLKFYEGDKYFKNFIEDAKYRSTYLVPLHLLQIEMIRRYRSRADNDEKVDESFLESVILISMGLQNSG